MPRPLNMNVGSRDPVVKLLLFHDEVTREWHKAISIEVGYLDAIKPDDSVNRHLLLLRLQAFGIGSILLK